MRERKPLELGFLQGRPRIRASRVRAVVAFGDITAFGNWTRRGSNSPEEFRSFMVRLYRTFIRFRNGNGYFVKLLGDGFMAVREVKKFGAKREVQSFLEHALKLDSEIHQIEKAIFPQPGTFRVRIVVGHVWKIVASHQDQEGSRQTDYLGYAVNLAARLLEVGKETGIICHESVKKILNNDSGFVLERLSSPARCPRGVDPEDVKALWAVHPLKDSRMAQAIRSRVTPR